jgi:hypothetical protein
LRAYRVNSNQAHQIVPAPTSSTVDANQISSVLEIMATLPATMYSRAE